MALHHVDEEALDQHAVCLGRLEVLRLDLAVDLRAAGGVGLGLGGQVVPVLRDEAIGVEAEDVEGDLLSGAGEVVHGVQEDLVAVDPHG